jgi:hypothetical protein
MLGTASSWLFMKSPYVVAELEKIDVPENSQITFQYTRNSHSALTIYIIALKVTYQNRIVIHSSTTNQWLI